MNYGPLNAALTTLVLSNLVETDWLKYSLMVLAGFYLFMSYVINK